MLDQRQGELRAQSYLALTTCAPAAKLLQVAQVRAILNAHTPSIDTVVMFPMTLMPGAPPRPVLVEPHRVPRRKLGSVEGRAALLHALAHIEFNAVNLALDAVTRFPHLPERFYQDWAGVAGEEAYHFDLLTRHLETLGFQYGDFPAHNGLWEIALKTGDDPLARMGLVPRILEARGLDVTPAIQTRLRQVGDQASAELLDIILRDEIGHVQIGNDWFHWFCRHRGLDPRTCFESLLRRYDVAPPHPPFNMSARVKAGFTAEELALWTQVTR